MIRTSQSHPIRVDFVADAPFPGRLGLTIAPGKKAESLFGYRWERDLTADLDVLEREFRMDALVSLMELHEYERYAIADLFEQTADRGIEVRHLPIVDTSVPVPEQAETFDGLVDHILKLLAAGKTVVVHCRGGLGRSGLVAAAALVAAGMPADEAIGLVRRSRPGAVENARQVEYVRAFARKRSAGQTAGASA